MLLEPGRQKWGGIDAPGSGTGSCDRTQGNEMLINGLCRVAKGRASVFSPGAVHPPFGFECRGLVCFSQTPLLGQIMALRSGFWLLLESFDGFDLGMGFGWRWVRLAGLGLIAATDASAGVAMALRDHCY